MRLDAFWSSERWLDYERACGSGSHARERELSVATWTTRVVDLAPPESALWTGVRRSYHSLINNATHTYLPSVRKCEAQPPQMRDILSGVGAGGLIRTARAVHVAESGRETRPLATWDIMGDWADTGNGLLSMAFDYVDRPPEMRGWPPCVGYAYFIIDGAWAYYASAATLRRNVNHALVWWAMLALKARGVRWCELGWQGQATDEKGKSIEFFRRGFGGVDVALDAELP